MIKAWMTLIALTALTIEGAHFSKHLNYYRTRSVMGILVYVPDPWRPHTQPRIFHE